MADWEGIADADAHLGRPFPLPTVVLPLARWVDVASVGTGAELAWSLDDSRPGSPGRIAQYVGAQPPPERELPGGGEPRSVDVGGIAGVLRSSPLERADPGLRPVLELSWQAGGLHVRLTAQGPWTLEQVLEIAASIVP